jgi:hypothetical protein
VRRDCELQEQQRAQGKPREDFSRRLRHRVVLSHRKSLIGYAPLSIHPPLSFTETNSRYPGRTASGAGEETAALAACHGCPPDRYH